MKNVRILAITFNEFLTIPSGPKEKAEGSAEKAKDGGTGEERPPRRREQPRLRRQVETDQI